MRPAQCTPSRVWDCCIKSHSTVVYSPIKSVLHRRYTWAILLWKLIQLTYANIFFLTIPTIVQINGTLLQQLHVRGTDLSYFIETTATSSVRKLLFFRFFCRQAATWIVNNLFRKQNVLCGLTIVMTHQSFSYAPVRMVLNMYVSWQQFSFECRWSIHSVENRRIISVHRAVYNNI